MKIGVISRGSPDYSIDIVTDGLIRLLGRQGVSLDYNNRGGWGGQYIQLLQGFEGPEPYDIHDADVLIASDRSLEAMKQWMKKTGRTAVAVVDGADGDAIATEVLSKVQVYFKREYIKGRTYAANIKPLPFAAIPEALNSEVKISRQVFYAGHPTHHFRLEIARVLTEMGHPPIVERIEKADYNRKLMESLIGISVRGNGWDTYRFWEIPYFGACMLAQRPNIVIPGAFVDGQEAVYYDSIGDFKEKLKMLLANPDEAVKIAEAGRKASMERHLSINRAKTVLEALS
jgi:hypothetical protein